MDYVTVSELRLRGVHGHNPYERENEQDFLFNVKAGCDITSAETSDNLPDTVDFNFLRDTVKKIFASKSYHLLEAMAHDIIAELLVDPRIHEVTLSIQKPEVWPDAVPGITLTRSR